MECLEQIKEAEFAATVTVLDDWGLHARPAAGLVRIAQAFKADISLSTDHQTADAKSILDILTLAAANRTRLRVTCRGEDAREAGRAVTDFFSRK